MPPITYPPRRFRPTPVARASQVRGGPRTNIPTGEGIVPSWLRNAYNRIVQNIQPPEQIATRGGRSYLGAAQTRQREQGAQPAQQQQAQTPAYARRFQTGALGAGYGAPITKPVGQMTPQELQQYVLNKPPGPTGVVFNPNIPRAGEEFRNYLLQQGVRPYLPASVGGVAQASYVDWLLSRNALYDYGINPYARPIPEQQQGQQQPYGGGGGYGYGGGGGGGYPRSGGGGFGGGGVRPQFPGRQPSMPNVPRWMQELVNWRI